MSFVHFKSIQEALSQPCSEHFWLSYESGIYDTGHKESFFRNNPPDDQLTFDISNNKILANINHNGTLKGVTIYRGSYRANPAAWMWPGVWMYKDYSKWGPYTFKIKVADNMYDLSNVDWPYKTSLLANIFPQTVLKGDQIQVNLIAYAPISESGEQRLSCLVYGALVTNTCSSRLSGCVILPTLFANKENLEPKDGFDIERFYPDDLDILLGDRKEKTKEIAFDLAPDESIWVPAILYSPGEPVVEEIDKWGSLHWLNTTWAYFKQMTGELSMPQDTFTQEFFERNLHQCFHSINMDGNNRIAGSNWGSYPSTRQTWMKDLVYSFFPMYMFEPELLKKGIEWLLQYSVRPSCSTFKGGVSHNLGVALSPVILAGLYYESTGDKAFFLNHNEILPVITSLLQQVIQSKETEEVWLFPSRLISDGDAAGDYHTGSNVCAWYAFKSFSRILAEVYEDSITAAAYLLVAEHVHADLDAHQIIDGPYGKQYIEGVNSDGSIPCMFHEAEESDVTLMPVYGYTDFNNSAYKNYAKFALSEFNHVYSPETKGINWGMNYNTKITEASFPGYITGLVNITNLESMNDAQGYMTEIKKLTDLDGSLWWWPYPGNEYGETARNHIAGKCGWASGVFAALFVSEILGIKYDAPAKTLTLRPFSPSSSYTWRHLKLGTGLFDISYYKLENEAVVEVTNHNDFTVKVNVGLVIDPDVKHVENIVSQTTKKFVLAG